MAEGSPFAASEELGGAFVTVGADLSGLDAGEAGITKFIATVQGKVARIKLEIDEGALLKQADDLVAKIRGKFANLVPAAGGTPGGGASLPASSGAPITLAPSAAAFRPAPPVSAFYSPPGVRRGEAGVGLLFPPPPAPPPANVTSSEANDTLYQQNVQNQRMVREGVQHVMDVHKDAGAFPTVGQINRQFGGTSDVAKAVLEDARLRHAKEQKEAKERGGATESEATAETETGRARPRHSSSVLYKREQRRQLADISELAEGEALAPEDQAKHQRRQYAGAVRAARMEEVHARGDAIQQATKLGDTAEARRLRRGGDLQEPGEDDPSTKKDRVKRLKQADAAADRELVAETEERGTRASRRRRQAQQAEAREGGGEGEGGRGRGNLARRNLLSVRGLEGLGIGGSATAAFAAYEGVRLGGELAGAYRTANNPGRLLNTTTDQGTRNLMMPVASELAQNMGQREGLGAIHGIPVLGQLTRLVDNIGGVSQGLEQRGERLQQRLGGTQAIHQEFLQSNIEDLAAKGDVVGQSREAREQAVKEMANKIGATESFYTQATSGEMIVKDETLKKGAGQFRYAKGGEKGAFAAGGGEALHTDAVQSFSVWDDKTRTRHTLDNATTDEIKRVNEVKLKEEQRAGRIFEAQQRSAAMGTQATEMQSRIPALAHIDDRQAMLLRQASERMQLGAKYNTLTAQATQATAPAIANQQRADEAALAAKQAAEVKEVARQNQADILAATTAGISARQRANKQFFAAEVSDFEAAATAELKAVEGRDKEVVDATRRSIVDRRSALYETHTRQVRESKETAVAGGEAAALQGAGRGFDARMLMTRIENQQKLDAIEDPKQRAAQQFAFDQQRELALQQHAQERYNIHHRLAAEGAGDRARSERHDIFGSTIEEGETLTASVRNADKEDREATRAAALEKINLREKQLSGVMGGGGTNAVSGYAGFIPGNPFDTTYADIKLARQQNVRNRQDVMAERGIEEDVKFGGKAAAVSPDQAQRVTEDVHNILSTLTKALGYS